MYAGSFSVLGAVMPYLALDLKERGVVGIPLALAMGALPAGRLLAAPAWSVLADATNSQRNILRLACGMAVLGLLSIPHVLGWWAPLAVLLLAVGRAPMGPVVDAMTLQALRGDRNRYGQVRRWGSLGYLISTLLVPVIVINTGCQRLLPGTIMAVVLCGIVWGVTDGTPAAGPTLRPALRHLSKDRPLKWILTCAALHFSAHVATTSFLAVHMTAMGLSETWTGVALALGVAVEIALMSHAKRFLDEFGAGNVLVFATTLAIGRWLLTALATEGWQLVLLQGLHGLTFGAFWLAAVAMVARRAPASITTSAQGLLSAAVGGVGSFIGLMGASLISEQTDTRMIFWCGAIVATVASLCAIRLRTWSAAPMPEGAQK